MYPEDVSARLVRSQSDGRRLTSDGECGCSVVRQHGVYHSKCKGRRHWQDDRDREPSQLETLYEFDAELGVFGQCLHEVVLSRHIFRAAEQVLQTHLSRVGHPRRTNALGVYVRVILLRSMRQNCDD